MMPGRESEAVWKDLDAALEDLEGAQAVAQAPMPVAPVAELEEIRRQRHNAIARSAARVHDLELELVEAMRAP